MGNAKSRSKAHQNDGRHTTSRRGLRRHRSGKREKIYAEFKVDRRHVTTVNRSSNSASSSTGPPTANLRQNLALHAHATPPLPARAQRVQRNSPAPPSTTTRTVQTPSVEPSTIGSKPATDSKPPARQIEKKQPSETEEKQKNLQSADKSNSGEAKQTTEKKAETALAKMTEALTENMLDLDDQNKLALAVQLLFLEELDTHLGKTCCACHDQNFSGYRYSCLMCRDYDLCDDCFQERRTSHAHQANHPMLVIANATDRVRDGLLQKLFELNPDQLQASLADRTFDNIKCDGCKVEPIRGIRLKCDDCHDFDLCWNCFKSESVSYTHDDAHTMIAHLWPVPPTFELQNVQQTDNSAKSGCFGKVCKVEYEGKTRAMKTITPTNLIQLKTFVNEINAYKEIRCNSIVKFFGYSAQQEPPQLYLLMEYMQGGNLQDVITEKRDVSIRRKLQWLISVAKGLKCMHRKGFVHKDIKPDNILMDGRGNVKIGDMGTAIHDDGKHYFRDALAPRRYAAPEILSGDKFTNKVDMFSFGLLMNELLTYTPYPGKIPVVPIRFAVETEVLWPLVESCVSGDPDERPSAETATEELEFLETGFWKSLRSKEQYVKLATAEKDKVLLQYWRSMVKA